MWTLAVPDEKELNLESTLFQIKCMGAEMLIVFQSIFFNNWVTFVALWKEIPNFDTENLSDIYYFPVVKP